MRGVTTTYRTVGCDIYVIEPEKIERHMDHINKKMMGLGRHTEHTEKHRTQTGPLCLATGVHDTPARHSRTHTGERYFGDYRKARMSALFPQAAAKRYRSACQRSWPGSYRRAHKILTFARPQDSTLPLRFESVSASWARAILMQPQQAGVRSR